MYYDQAAYHVRFEWGQSGFDRLARPDDTVIVVDVLSFTTCVDVIADRDGTVIPYRWRDDTAADHAAAHDAILARGRGEGGVSLSPTSLLALDPGARIVLPSLNGATLAAGAPVGRTAAGCLRNADAVAGWANAQGRPITVIASGERWPEDDLLRPAIEDYLGAAAIMSALAGTMSPEAEVAISAYRGLDDIRRVVLGSSSGRQLSDRGYENDVLISTDVNASTAVPVLTERGFRNTGSRGVA